MPGEAEGNSYFRCLTSNCEVALMRNSVCGQPLRLPIPSSKQPSAGKGGCEQTKLVENMDITDSTIDAALRRLPELPTIRSPKPIGIEEPGQLPQARIVREVDLGVQGHGRGRRVIALGNLLKKRGVGQDAETSHSARPARAVN